MSSEQFDKHIRKKLESVRPPYQEQAWQNFKNLLPQPWYVTFFKTYQGWVYGSLSTLAVLTTSYLYYQQKEENKNLHETIATLQSQDLQTPDNTAVFQDSVLTKPARTDSVKIAPPILTIAKNTPEVAVEDALPLPDRKIALAEQPLSQTTETERIQKSEKAIDTPSRQPEVLPILIQEKERNITQTNVPGNRNTALPGFSDTEKTPVNSSDTSIASPPNSLSNSVKIPAHTLASPAAKAIIAQQPDSAGGTTSQATKQQKPGGNLLAAMQIRLGLTTDFNGLKTFAAGPALELFWNDRFSLNAALTVGSHSQLKHAGPPDFNRVTGKRFEDVYRRHIPRYDRIREIEVTTSLIRLPITLNYYLPTNSNFSVMLSGGTSLNLSANQLVAFRSTFQGEERYNRFEARPKTSAFNSLRYGVGVQYKYGRLVGQVTPYLKSYFRQPEYFNPEHKFGINLGVKYDLRK
ncbi:hypothetical protein [Adhaeribacter aerolatus]|nr:hypothetical protein [Adhaeribacter aerolatus]